MKQKKVNVIVALEMSKYAQIVSLCIGNIAIEYKFVYEPISTRSPPICSFA
jgi:hypothetical protein